MSKKRIFDIEKVVMTFRHITIQLFSFEPVTVDRIFG